MVEMFPFFGLRQENRREYCNDCYIFMTEIQFMILYAWMFLKLRSLLLFYFQVYDHKEARSGKSCYVRVTSSLLADLRQYRDLIRSPQSGKFPWLFFTKAGNFIQPSVSKIIALIQSRTYGIMSN